MQVSAARRSDRLAHVPDVVTDAIKFLRKIGHSHSRRNLRESCFGVSDRVGGRTALVRAIVHADTKTSAAVGWRRIQRTVKSRRQAVPLCRLDAVVERKGAHKSDDDKSSAEHGTAAQAQRSGRWMRSKNGEFTVEAELLDSYW